MSENLSRIIDKKASDIEEILEAFLPAEKGFEKTVYEAMNYSVKAGGKRLRPMLMKEFFCLFGGIDEATLKRFMTAIEMIHSYSLVHDDLPALDDDDMRRGRPSTHKQFGEAMGILAGDALLNAAYEQIAKAQRDIFMNGDLGETEKAERARRAALAFDKLSSCAGTDGMIGGQVVDVELTGKDIDADRLFYIYHCKTGALLAAAMTVGAILGGADEKECDTVEEIGYDIGMAFQIQDDILDVTGSEEKLGKPIHSDEELNKSTYVAVHGIEESREAVERYTKKAITSLDGLDVKQTETGEFIKELFLMMAKRDH